MNLLLPVLLQAAPPDAGGRGLMITLWYILGFGAIFYFFFIRPQRRQHKQHAAMLSQLKKGDEVVTAGGIVGQVVHLTDDRVTIKTGETRLVVMRARIARVGTEEPAGAGADPTT